MGPQQAKVEGVNTTATGDGQKLALALGARIVNGDLALGPEIRFIPPARTTFVRRLPPWPALGPHHGMGHGPRAASAAAAIHHELSHHRPRAFSEAVRARRDPGQPGGTALLRRVGYSRSRAAGSAGQSWLHPAWMRGSHASSRPGRTSFRLLPVLPTPTCPTTGATGPTSIREASSIDDLASPAGHEPAGYCTTRSLRTTRASSEAKTHHASTVANRRSSRLDRCAPSSYTTKAGLRWIASIACSVAQDQPIPGLYAAGATGQGGLLLKGHGHHLAWAFVSGRRAGRFASQGTAKARLARSR